MNREAKFRIWDGERMRVLGNMFVGAGQIGFSDEHWVDLNEQDNEDSVCMQSTGQRDKNGHQIFEGDIVSLDPRPNTDDGPQIAKISYLPECMGYYAELGEEIFPFSGQNIKDDDGGAGWRTWLRTHDYQNHAVEVIGNIYENPDIILT